MKQVRITVTVETDDEADADALRKTVLAAVNQVPTIRILDSDTATMSDIKPLSWYDESELIANVSEYDLHDMLASHLADANIDGESMHGIKITPLKPEKFTPQLIQKWEAKVTDTMKHLNELDCEFHDDAEYTCFD